MPTVENLVRIRLDSEIDGQRYEGAFTSSPSGKIPFFGSGYFFYPFRTLREKKGVGRNEPIVDLLSNEEVDALEAKARRKFK